MALTDAQRRAQARYVRESVKQTSLRFYPSEADLWEWLCAQENKQGYLKGLIRADLEARGTANGVPAGGTSGKARGEGSAS